MDNNKPLSPHIQIYSWNISSLISISHRITGVINNFALAWFSALLVLLGVIHLTLGGIGQDGFFTLREFYFLRSNTFTFTFNGLINIAQIFFLKLLILRLLLLLY